jgi:hypothetical protein
VDPFCICSIFHQAICFKKNNALLTLSCFAPTIPLGISKSWLSKNLQLGGAQLVVRSFVRLLVC